MQKPETDSSEKIRVQKTEWADGLSDNFFTFILIYRTFEPLMNRTMNTRFSVSRTAPTALRD